MAANFFFYDLETSGISPRSARIMQFAGQRTDMDLQPIGEPVNALIKLTPDVVPEPDAIMVTGITPQETLVDGYTEAEFLRYFYDEVVQPDTIFIGYNSVRFDDEFMRFLHYRNFYDPYEWQWADGCSRWDLLDVVRMTRALRPDGIEWPFADNGKPTNRLELLTTANRLEHAHAHDALSDVLATIAIAKLIKTKQPGLFDYLLSCRGKKEIAQLIAKDEPFVYTSGRYSTDWLHTSAVVGLHTSDRGETLVYDLRFDPTPYLAMSVDELIEAWKYNPDPGAVRLPVKTLKHNHCPAAAPLGVIKDVQAQQRIDLTVETISHHRKLLRAQQSVFVAKLEHAVEQMNKTRAADDQAGVLSVDERLYEGFFGPGDKQAMRALRQADGPAISAEAFPFSDERLSGLLPLYKARNFPQVLTSEERAAWDAFCAERVFAGGQNSRLAKYFQRLSELAAAKPTDNQKYLLEEMQLYGQSIVPADAAE